MRADVEIVDVRVIHSFFELESRDSKLDDTEIESSFLDPLVEFEMVGEWTLDAAKLSDKPGELTVESNEVSLVDVREYLREELVNVGRVDLHYYSWSYGKLVLLFFNYRR